MEFEKKRSFVFNWNKITMFETSYISQLGAKKFGHRKIPDVALCPKNS